MWSDVLDEVMKEMLEAHEDALNKNNKHDFVFNINPSNILTVYGRLTDTYTLCSISFSSVDWDPYSDDP